MNVIVSNQKKDELNSLDIDVIKSISGEYSTDELISMFKNFFYDKMIVDVTSIRDYIDITNIERLAMGLGSEKLIILLTDELCTSVYLNGLIDIGIYNFTNNIKAIKRLIAKPNTYDDVKQIKEQSISSNTQEIEKEDIDYIKQDNNVNDDLKIIGIKNVTENAGSTTLSYMLLKELKRYFGNNVYAIEIDKHDFMYFNEKNLLSVSSSEVESKIDSLSNAQVILIDLNESHKEALCDDIIYLLEPSTIMLNKLIASNRNVFDRLKGKKIVLNKSMLSNKDVTEFEYESNSKIFYNIHPLDDRSNNQMLNDLLSRLGIYDGVESFEGSDNKIFGIFKH